MNDQSTRWSPGPGDEDDGERRRQRTLLERQLMERARRAAERDHQKEPRRTLQHVIAMAAAVGLVLIIALGFDAFLTSMQKVMRMLDAEEERQKQEQAAPKPDEPMPAYVVPSD
ncbi:MAG TPA: hypothetical protein VF851_01715 [Steroidobacteraceae bacterium]